MNRFHHLLMFGKNLQQSIADQSLNRKKVFVCLTQAAILLE